MTFPELPYRTHGDPTIGAANIPTSQARALREASDGTVEARQRDIVSLLEQAGPWGLTWPEIAAKTGLHHGQVSGVLSSLHKAGRIAALKTGKQFPDHERNGCGVYLALEHAQGRLVRPFGGKKEAPAPARPRLTEQELELLTAVRTNVRDAKDRGIVVLRVPTAEALVAIIDKLNA